MLGDLWEKARGLFGRLGPGDAGERPDFEALFSELTRAASDNLIKAGNRVYVPSDYLINLSQYDMDSLERISARSVIQKELQRAMRAYVREKGYLTDDPDAHKSTPLTVRLTALPGLARGYLGITISFAPIDPHRPDARTVFRPPVGKTLASLEVLTGPQQGEALAITRFPAEIGRVEPDNHPDLGLIDERQWIGRHHARIEQVGGSYYLVDTGSVNGTKVDGVPVAAEVRTPLTDSVEILLADWVRLRFHVGDRVTSVQRSMRT